MKLLVFLVALAIVGLIVTGAITLQKTDDNKITIQIDRSRVREDAARVVEKGKRVLRGAEAALENGATEADGR
jgi:hypothetical protein